MLSTSESGECALQVHFCRNTVCLIIPQFMSVLLVISLFLEILAAPVMFKCYSSGSNYNGILKNTKPSLFCDICGFIPRLSSSSCATGKLLRNKDYSTIEKGKKQTEHPTFKGFGFCLGEAFLVCL